MHVSEVKLANFFMKEEAQANTIGEYDGQPARE
jgi:hypothetical protein